MISKNARTGLSLLAACVCACAQPRGEDAWTEQAVLNLFERQSPVKREARATGAAAVESIRGRTLWPNPVAVYTRETVGFNEFAQAEQQLPISGRLRLIAKAADPAREAAEADGAARVWEIRSNLRLAFQRTLAAQRQEEILQTSLGEVQDVIRLLQTREQEGEGSRYDRMRVERETADLRADAAVARARARSERSILQSYLPPATTIALVAGDLAPLPLASNTEDLARRSIESRAEFRAQTSRLAQLGFEQQAAERLRIPEPTVTAGLKRTQIGANQNGSGAVIGIAIPLPIFNKGQAEAARLAAEQDRIRAQRDALSQQVTALVAGAHEIYATRRAALAAFDQETGDSGAELLRVATVGYQEGELGILQLLDAYRLKRQTALRRLDLQLALKESELELSRAAGYEVTQ